MDPLVSIIIPCFNEEKYISGILEDILNQDYPRELTEVLVVDGMSSDGTQAVIRQYQEKYLFIRLEINEQQFVPFALNLGIRRSKGEVIMIMGSHAKYPPGYISVLVKALIELNADNVGGVCVATPAEPSTRARAIAASLSSPFGVGDARFRIGAGKRMKVDTVTFGCYRRSVFERIGMFDEELLRNQDDEFNGRLLKNGGVIYLIPEVRILYYPRSTIKGVQRMYYQYGLFKPLVASRLGRPATIRQMVPPLFVLYLLSFLAASFFHPVFRIVFISVTGLYLLLDIVFSLRTCLRERSFRQLLYLPWLFPLIHLSYGWGYLTGIVKFIIFRKKVKGVKTSR
ncbi:MAG: glycosyltransferase family 2 protein [Bacteroidetes bacterium]|nr:glycosyltransferase family 2 protein [Bacteroidota bacterium]